jgi:hypothetical protein
MSTLVDEITVRKNSGADVGVRPRINLIEGGNVTLTVVDDGAGNEIDVTIAASTTGGTIVVRKNSGADVGTQPRLNFIEGANVTLTVANDAGDGEVDITIAAAGGGAGGDTSQFFPAVSPNVKKGTHAGVELPDGYDVTVTQEILIPKAFVTVDKAVAIVITAGTGNLRWGCASNWGSINAAEDYNTHTDSIAANDSACTVNRLTTINISAALTGAAAYDLVGMDFTRYGAHANDTINAVAYYLGVYISGTV